MTNEGDNIFSSNASSDDSSDDDVEGTEAIPTNMSSMPGNEAPSRSEPTQRSTKTRGVTLLTKIRDFTDCTIQFCPDTGRAIGAYSSKYANWVGLEARSKISILVSDWHKIDADEKARLWAAIKWNIEEDDKLKKKTMSIASNSWRSFKLKLVKSYVRKNKTPYSKYGFIKLNTWDEFVKLKSTPEFEALSQKNSEHAKLNDNPHHLGSQGYLGKQDSWATYKDRGIMPEIQNMYSKRARDFILARLVKSGPDEFILPDKMKPIVEDIIEKDKQFSQGDWDPEVAVDPLAAVLGLEHPGHTRGVGHNVGLRVGLGLGNKRRRPNKKDAEIKDLRERTSNLEQQVKELKAERLSRNNASPAGSPMVKSSAGSTALDPRIESILEPTNCDLVFRCGGAKILVAKGLAYPLSTDVLHGNPLEEGFMKVQVDMVMDGCEEYDLPVPMPNADIEKLGQAIGNFIQWEIRSVVLRQSTSNKSVTSAPPMSEPILPHIQKEDVAHSNKVQKYDEAHSKRVVTASEPRKNKKIVKKTKALPNLMQDRPPAMKELFQCLHFSKEWPTTGVTVLVEAGVLGHTSMHIGVEYDDLKLLMTNGWLDQNIIAWYLTDLHKIVSQNSRNKCAFIAPGVINALEIEWDDTLVIDTILSTMMHQKEKEFFLAPYSQGHHWSLLIIRPRRSLVYVLDSMMTNGKTAETYMIKGLIDTATAKYNHATGSSQANTSVTWRLNKCNQQQDGWECGYYVVKQIFQFVMHEQYSSSLKDTWTTTDPFTSTQVEEIACNIARSFTLKRMKESKMW